MNDGIKEILDYLKDEKWDYNPGDMTPYKVFFREERDKLLDYITNLQQELQRKDNNWNELKKHIGEEWYCYDNESIEFKVAKDILDKIKELEKM